MRGSRASAASGVSWAIVLLTLSVSGSAPAQDGYPQVPALSRSSPTALVAPAPEASPCACPVTARRVGYQAVTGQVQESSQFMAAPYNADAAVDGDDGPDYAAHATFGDYPNWFVVGLSGVVDVWDVEIMWGSTTLYGQDFEVWAYRDRGMGFEWERIVQEVGWAPVGGNALYVKRWGAPVTRVCKLQMVVTRAAGQARTVMRRFAWNQLAEWGGTVEAATRMLGVPYGVEAALDGGSGYENYAAGALVGQYPQWFRVQMRQPVELRSVQVFWYSATVYGQEFEVWAYRNGRWERVIREVGWSPPTGTGLYNRVLATPVGGVEALSLVVRGAAGQERLVVRQFSWNRPLLASVRYSTRSDLGHAEYPVVIKDGTVYKMWYSGFNPADGRWRIHYAVSTDGTTWQKFGVVLDVGATTAWDGGRIAFPFVVKDVNGQYHMWYGGAAGDTTDYEIGYATSANGLTWTKWSGNPVIRRTALGARLIVDPAVVYDPGGGSATFQMWLNVFTSAGGGLVYRTTSANGATWSPPTLTPIAGSPGVYTIDVRLEPAGGFTLHYAAGSNRLDVYRASSANGLTWGSPTLALQAAPSTPWHWDSYANYGMTVVDAAGQRQMWFNGVPRQARCDGGVFGVGQIGTATETTGSWLKAAANPVLRAGSVAGD